MNLMNEEVETFAKLSTSNIPLTAQEKNIISNYRNLSKDGQKHILEQIEYALYKYKKALTRTGEIIPFTQQPLQKKAIKKGSTTANTYHSNSELVQP